MFCNRPCKYSVYYQLGLSKDYVSGCAAFSFNCQSVSSLKAYLLLELFSSSLLAETGGKCPLVFSVTRVGLSRSTPYLVWLVARIAKGQELDNNNGINCLLFYCKNMKVHKLEETQRLSKDFIKILFIIFTFDGLILLSIFLF